MARRHRRARGVDSRQSNLRRRIGERTFTHRQKATAARIVRAYRCGSVRHIRGHPCRPRVVADVASFPTSEKGALAQAKAAMMRSIRALFLFCYILAIVRNRNHLATE